MRFIGLMSGTSVDAVDGVLAEFESDSPDASFTTLAFASRPMPDALRRSLLDLQQPGPDELSRASLASIALTDLYAEVSLALLSKLKADQAGNEQASLGQIVAIGAHGQTVRHRPELGYTIQLIDGARLAELTGCPSVVDFRSGDVAAGGQGAPLVPAFHALAFSSVDKRRAVVNIGGIANVSLLPVGGGTVTGFDTGPGNLLMDAWCERHLGKPFDRNGDWAAGGTIDRALLDTMLAEPYFGLPAPKSTGRDLFTPAWLDHQLAISSPTHTARCPDNACRTDSADDRAGMPRFRRKRNQGLWRRRSERLPDATACTDRHVNRGWLNRCDRHRPAGGRGTGLRLAREAAHTESAREPSGSHRGSRAENTGSDLPGIAGQGLIRPRKTTRSRRLRWRWDS